MNLLLGDLPETITIDGRDYRINSGFHACLRIVLAFEDPELSIQEKYSILINNLFIDTPKDLAMAVKEGMIFLDGGQEGVEIDESQTPRLYSFSGDGNYIYAAFQQTHRIDLAKEDLHWWKFLGLFLDLGSDTVFVNLIGLRKRIKDGTATKEEQKQYRENRALFDVPEIETRSLEERLQEEEFLRLVNGKSEKI